MEIRLEVGLRSHLCKQFGGRTKDRLADVTEYLKPRRSDCVHLLITTYSDGKKESLWDVISRTIVGGGATVATQWSLLRHKSEPLHRAMLDILNDYLPEAVLLNVLGTYFSPEDLVYVNWAQGDVCPPNEWQEKSAECAFGATFLTLRYTAPTPPPTLPLFGDVDSSQPSYVRSVHWFDVSRRQAGWTSCPRCAVVLSAHSNRLPLRDNL